jgi:hypothetical protein
VLASNEPNDSFRKMRGQDQLNAKLAVGELTSHFQCELADEQRPEKRFPDSDKHMDEHGQTLNRDFPNDV